MGYILLANVVPIVLNVITLIVKKRLPAEYKKSHNETQLTDNQIIKKDIL
jgi:hypothetical protein